MNWIKRWLAAWIMPGYAEEIARLTAASNQLAFRLDALKTEVDTCVENESHFAREDALEDVASDLRQLKDAVEDSSDLDDRIEAVEGKVQIHHEMLRGITSAGISMLEEADDG